MNTQKLNNSNLRHMVEGVSVQLKRTVEEDCVMVSGRLFQILEEAYPKLHRPQFVMRDGTTSISFLVERRVLVGLYRLLRLY